MKTPENPIQKNAAVIRQNCLESARWLRSGAEYVEWMQSRNMTPLSPEDRLTRAEQYEARAEYWLTVEKGE